MERNKIYCGDARAIMADWPEQSIDMCITSPPYYQVRWYKSEPQIWGDTEGCTHEWTDVVRKPTGGKGDNANVGANRNSEANMRGTTVMSATYSKCGAFQCELGLEPDWEMYISDLCDVFDGVKQVLKETGSLYVNIGDTYNSNHGGGNAGKVNPEQTEQILACENRTSTKLPSSCLIGIPMRFCLEMMDRGWILKNTIIWHKPNAMPSSVSNRYTPDFEYIYFFVKSNKAQYWVNSRTMQVTKIKPLGFKSGIEGMDWDWFPCPICQERGDDPAYNEELRRHHPNYNQDGKSIRDRDVAEKERIAGLKATHEPLIKQDEVIDPRTGKPKAQYKGFNARYTAIPEEDAESMGSPRARYHRRCRDKKCVDGMKPRTLWKSHKYYFDQQLEPALTPGSKHIGGAREFAVKTNIETGIERNKRCVWDITTKGYQGAHFAVFPEKLLETPIKASCPKELCSDCGLPLIPVYEKTPLGANSLVGEMYGGDKDGNYHGQATKDYESHNAQNPSDTKRRILESIKNPKIHKGEALCEHVYDFIEKLRQRATETHLTGKEQEEIRQRYGAHPFRTDACTIPKGSVYQAPKEQVGYAGCGHDNVVKGLVLDPFFGAGTTALVARELGREWVGIDVKEEYCDLARERLGLKPPPLPKGQQTLAGRIWL